MNPDTGQVECLDFGGSSSGTVQSSPDAATNPFVEYLDHLSACSSHSAYMPLPLLDQVMTTTRIQGWNGDRCSVITTAWLMENPDQEALYSSCQYSHNTIALMTDEIAYEQARSMNFSFDSTNGRDVALSDALTQECEFSDTWINELVPSQ
jgi:hypothetical protein